MSVTNISKSFSQAIAFLDGLQLSSVSVWAFFWTFSLSTLCSPAINPNGAHLDKEQEYSSQWILATVSGTTACVRACGFGPSRDIWRNAGITKSPLARWAQPHTISGFLKATLKWSGSAKCGLFDGTFTDFIQAGHTWLRRRQSIKKHCLFYTFSHKRGSQNKLDHERPKSAKALRS